MHKEFDINIENLSKIEGHAALDIKVRGGKVEDVKLRIFENRRFFEHAIAGKRYQAVPQLASRICGTCSAAHLMCSIACIENALGIEPSEQTKVLRDLTLYGVNIRDHAMHLFLFVLPDLFGKDSVLDFPDSGKEHELLHKAFDIKTAGNALSTEIAGRTVHPPFPSIGAFMRVPTAEKCRALAENLKDIRESAIAFVRLFGERDFEFEMPDMDFIASLNDRYSYLGGGICHSEGFCIPRVGFERFFKENVVPYSQACGFSFQGRPYMVGALARMNLNVGALHPKTRKDMKEDNVFPSSNIFHNNLAQAIEIVHCIDSSIDLLEKWEFKQEPPVAPVKKGGEGVAVIEAPRGMLFYHIDIGADDTIRHANLVIPTAQNQIPMEKAIALQVDAMLAEGKKKDEIQRRVESLIRAFDPCMSCATHFLKINWM